MVHAAALRQTRGDAHLADDVTQAVFIVLARRAETIAIDCLPAWLLTTARPAPRTRSAERSDASNTNNGPPL